MRTHKTMALAATLSVAAAAVIADLPTGPVTAHAEVVSSRPSPDALRALRSCESGGDYTADSGNGYYGAYQFAADTWQSLGYDGYPNEAAPAVQDEAVARLYARSGWTPWPGCSEALDLPSMATVSAAAGPVVAEVAVSDPPPPPAPGERPAHSRFSQLVAEFG
ncbi:MAG: transglycosylase family protein [Acidimicrobiia bacterium]|nr:transglycosylase family protein [Acidimicrobiia bacterium]